MVDSDPVRAPSPPPPQRRSRSRHRNRRSRSRHRRRQRNGRSPSRNGRSRSRHRSRRRRERSRSGRRRERSRSGRRERSRSRSAPPMRHRRAERTWSPLPLTYDESFEGRLHTHWDSSTMLCVYNLSDHITSHDITRFFAHVGPMVSCTLKCNRFGESMGIAEVIYLYPRHAIRAIRMYREILLDGRPMKFEIVDI
ncbi:THO complex subunit 4A-like [Ipomoea triloba]|uniref:THO complex subunit 4A-like n=1 Tax=Ipomoea triloba TaxID=35885 RepID=UPI00125E1372|nr:THO complex subunit 4A-like [Ipomoea triloba]XP_031109002.1 THO complex subunit 4A-like [Ipomoea triloba]